MGLSRSQRSAFETIFLHIIECARTGKELKPNEVVPHGGRSNKIKTDSIQAQIVADAVEMGLSTSHAWHLLNQNELDEGRDVYSLSAVTLLIAKLNPKLVHTKENKSARIKMICGAGHVTCSANNFYKIRKAFCS